MSLPSPACWPAAQRAHGRCVMYRCLASGSSCPRPNPSACWRSLSCTTRAAASSAMHHVSNWEARCRSPCCNAWWSIGYLQVRSGVAHRGEGRYRGRAKNIDRPGCAGGHSRETRRLPPPGDSPASWGARGHPPRQRPGRTTPQPTQSPSSSDTDALPRDRRHGLEQGHPGRVPRPDHRRHRAAPPGCPAGDGDRDRRQAVEPPRHTRTEIQADPAGAHHGREDEHAEHQAAPPAPHPACGWGVGHPRWPQHAASCCRHTSKVGSAARLSCGQSGSARWCLARGACWRGWIRSGR